MSYIVLPHFDYTLSQFYEIYLNCKLIIHFDSSSLFSSSYVRMSRWASKDMSSTNFEEIMMKHNMRERDDFKSIQSMNIFYQAGTSKQSYPVFYYIARRFK